MYNLALRLGAQVRLHAETLRLLSSMATIGDQLMDFMQYKGAPLQEAVEARVDLVAQSQDRLNARKPEITNMVSWCARAGGILC
jgi:hypothetical protein